MPEDEGQLSKTEPQAEPPVLLPFWIDGGPKSEAALGWGSLGNSRFLNILNTLEMQGPD